MTVPNYAMRPSPLPAGPAPVRPAQWSDRTVLLPKQMLYVFSLHVTATARGPYLQVRPRTRGIGHLLGDSMVEVPEGFRCETPSGSILRGDGEIGAPESPTSSALRLHLTAALASRGPLLIDCRGVVSFDGGPDVFRAGGRPLRGSAFIATRYESALPAYRWLNRRQLFGVGRVEREPGPSDDLTLGFSFDLYAAA